MEKHSNREFSNGTLLFNYSCIFLKGMKQNIHLDLLFKILCMKTRPSALVPEYHSNCTRFHMVSLYFGHVSLHSSALPIPVNQTPKLTEILCLQMLCLPCAFSYPIAVFFLFLRFKNHASQMSPYRITSVTGTCRRELCVVCPAPAAMRPPHLSCSIDRSIHQTRHHDSWPSFAASDLLPCRRHPPQWHHHHWLSRWTWGVHGSTREVALFCFCLCYALLSITFYFIVMFTP